jgi:hypothetical protein
MFQKQCHPALVCENPNGGDKPGTCQSTSSTPTQPQPTSCLTSDDCDCDTSYCLYSTNPESGCCVPYEREGGTCGGFIDPKYQKQCHPSLECAYPLGGGGDLPGTCQQIYLF